MGLASLLPLRSQDSILTYSKLHIQGGLNSHVNVVSICNLKLCLQKRSRIEAPRASTLNHNQNIRVRFDALGPQQCHA